MTNRKVEMSVTLRKLQRGENGEPGPAGPAGENAVVATLSPPAIVYNADAANTDTLWCHLEIKDGSETVAPEYCRIYRQNGAEIDLSHGVRTVGGVEIELERDGGHYAIGFYPIEGATLSETLSVHTGRGTNLFELPLPVTRVANGEQGRNGDNGAIVRVTEWEVGKEYRNDPAGGTADADGNRYIDVVCRTGDDGEVLGYWECRSNHVSSEATMPTPTMTSGDQAYGWWLEMNAMKPIVSPLIIANNAVLRFIQGNSVKIFDDAGALVAGVQAPSGAAPAFYANPQRYPIAVAAQWRQSTSNALDLTASYSSEDGTLIANRYLHVKYTTTYSDGSTSVRGVVSDDRAAANTSVPAPILEFVARPDRQGFDPAREFVSSTACCTSVGRPVLWCKGNWPLPIGWKVVGEQEQGALPQHAMWQQSLSGNATYGNPSGPRVAIKAAPELGALPRVEIYAADGEPTTMLDGATYADPSRIFPNPHSGASEFTFPEATSVSCTTNASQQTASAWAGIAGQANGFSVVYGGGVLRIPAGAIALRATLNASTGDVQVRPNAYAAITLDGVPLQSISLEASGRDTVSWEAMSVPVAAGIHALKLEVSLCGGPLSTATATMQQLRLAVSYSQRICRYFANGWAVGSDTDNYAMCYNENGAMRFTVVNPTCGLRITDTAVQIRRNGGSWTNL